MLAHNVLSCSAPASARCPAFRSPMCSCHFATYHPLVRLERHKRCDVAPHAQQDDARPAQEFGLQAPAKPKTPYGELLSYYLKMEPQLFKTAVEDQLRKLHEEKEARDAVAATKPTESQGAPGTLNGDLILYQRMQELRSSEVRATLEDLMYVSILEKFLLVGVDMLPRMDGRMDVSVVNLQSLTEGIHSKEALELVREHLTAIMGPVANQYSNIMLKMSKFQMAQVYAASVMFGYFLRRVDERFRLEKALGTLPVTHEDAVARLERLFASASEDDSADPDSVPVDNQVVDLDSPMSPSSSEAGSTTSSSGSSSSGRGVAGSRSPAPTKRPQSALRRYVDQFDQATMVDTARIMSAEGAALVERQTHALVGDIKALAKQLQDVVGSDATSIEEVMQRMAKAVEADKVETLTMTVATQRRAVLEAVAYGSFMRDVESHIQSDYAGLLTPMPSPTLPPGVGEGWGRRGDGSGGSGRRTGF